jgi:DNA-binding PadR family transcriptional regulator
MAIRAFIAHDRESKTYTLTDSGRATLTASLNMPGSEEHENRVHLSKESQLQCSKPSLMRQRRAEFCRPPQAHLRIDA